MYKLRTHYDNLQVARNASEGVIRAAYRTLSQKYHPDKNPDNLNLAQSRMKVINQAYEVLSNKVRRAEHDAWIKKKEDEIRFSKQPIEKDIDQAKDQFTRDTENISPIYRAAFQCGSALKVGAKKINKSVFYFFAAWFILGATILLMTAGLNSINSSELTSDATAIRTDKIVPIVPIVARSKSPDHVGITTDISVHSSEFQFAQWCKTTRLTGKVDSQAATHPNGTHFKILTLTFTKPLQIQPGECTYANGEMEKLAGSDQLFRQLQFLGGSNDSRVNDMIGKTVTVSGEIEQPVSAWHVFPLLNISSISVD